MREIHSAWHRNAALKFAKVEGKEGWLGWKSLSLRLLCSSKFYWVNSESSSQRRPKEESHVSQERLD